MNWQPMRASDLPTVIMIAVMVSVCCALYVFVPVNSAPLPTQVDATLSTSSPVFAHQEPTLLLVDSVAPDGSCFNGALALVPKSNIEGLRDPRGQLAIPMQPVVCSHVAATLSVEYAGNYAWAMCHCPALPTKDVVRLQ